jgi:2-aminoethylphosphonate-pyruvate transaminase
MFCPGPVDISDEVRTSIIQPMCSHRSPEFRTLYRDCVSSTRKMFNTTTHVPLFLTGSGTLAIESMIYSYLSMKKVAIFKNGFFAERWGALLRDHGCNYVTLDFGWNVPFNYDIELDDDIDVLFFVHHETSTTMINDLIAMNALARRSGKELVIDCVSSAGLYPIDLENLETVRMFAYSSNKCVSAYPGLSVVVCDPRVFDGMRDTNSYLNLRLYYDYFKKDETPFTPCIHNFLAYKTSVNHILNKGVSIFDETKEVMEYLKENIGLKTVLKKGEQCIWVCNFECKDPERATEKLHEKGITIYRCKNQLFDCSIQVAVLNKTKADVDTLLQYLKVYTFKS